LAASFIENNNPCLGNYVTFIGKLKASSGNIDASFVANQKLRIIHQSIGGIQGYILKFNRYADESTWNEEAKMG